MALATGDPHTASLEAPALQPELFPCQWGLLGNPWASLSRCSLKTVLHDQTFPCPTSSPERQSQYKLMRAQVWRSIPWSRQASLSGETWCVRAGSLLKCSGCLLRQCGLRSLCTRSLLSAQRSLHWWAEEEIASSEMEAVVLAQLLQLMPGVLPASDHCCLIGRGGRTCSPFFLEKL